jgi:hypothetical protein
MQIARVLSSLFLLQLLLSCLASFVFSGDDSAAVSPPPPPPVIFVAFCPAQVQLFFMASGFQMENGAIPLHGVREARIRCAVKCFIIV